jgi:UDP-GlcNAc:undecaprenyl-phosphate GlcNAc-1-phosphate transferase
MLGAWLIMVAAGFWGHRICLGWFPADVQKSLAGLASVKHLLGTIVLGAVLVTAMGMADDRKAMSALPKFILQALVAALTACMGLRIHFLHAIPGANTLVTVLWLMTVMNAMNFFDNMDGLAGGASALAAFFMLFVAAYRGQNFVATLAALTGGAATGFLCWNAPPARLFMGDGGSHFLGYLLAISGVMTTFYQSGESPTPMPILIPMLALGIPLADAVAVVIIRLRLGVPIYKGDNRHISHRFVALGLSRPQAVLSVLLLCFIVGTAGLTLLWLPPAGSLLVIALVAAVFAVISIIQFYIHPNP